MSEIDNLTVRIVSDDRLACAYADAEWLQSDGAKDWPEESIWKPEFEFVRKIANKIHEEELAYLIAYMTVSQKEMQRRAYIEFKGMTMSKHLISCSPAC